MSSNTVSSAGTIDGLAGLLTFGVKIANFTAMWQTIWTWDLIAFGVSHAASGLLAAFRFRKQLRRYTFALPVVFTFLGLLIPATAGLITALLIAGIYVRAGFEMTTTEALAWGVGQFVLYTVSTYSPSYSTL